MANITNIPAPRVPFIDDRTGLMAREWYRFFLNLFTLTGQGQTSLSLDSLQIGPPTSYDGIQQDGTVDNAPAALDYSELAALTSLVQGLTMAPPNIETQKLYSGSFYDTTTQTAAAINTAYALTFNSTSHSAGVRIGSPTSRIICDNPGLYNFQFSVQLDNTSGGDHNAYLWARINGVDVSASAGQVRLKGNNGELVAAWNYVLQVAAGDYFELMWAVSDTAVQTIAVAATSPVPAIPSIILTVTQVSI